MIIRFCHLGLHHGGADEESEGSLPGERVHKINAQPNPRGSRSNPNRCVMPHTSIVVAITLTAIFKS